jgi:hypothetical protein
VWTWWAHSGGGKAPAFRPPRCDQVMSFQLNTSACYKMQHSALAGCDELDRRVEPVQGGGRLLVRLCNEGKQVVRLKGGCCSVFSRVHSELAALRSAGCDVDMGALQQRGCDCVRPAA